MASEVAVEPARPVGRDGADTPTRTPDRDAADDFDAGLVSDLHDCFGMMYAGSEWDSDDEDGHPKPPTDGFDLPRLLSELSALISAPHHQVPSKRRLFPPRQHAPTVFPSTSPLPPLPSIDTYAPFSPLPLLARLRTFGAAGLSPSVPDAVGALACALHGWVSTGRDALVCSRSCGAHWGVGGLDDLRPAVRQGVILRLAGTLSTRHNPGCAWRITPSPPELAPRLRRILHPLTASSLAPLARALAQQSLSGPVAPVWTSPAPEVEIAFLAAAIKRHLPPLHQPVHDPEAENRPPQANRDPNAPPTPEPTEALAAALALFGWYAYDPTFPADHVVPHGTPTDIVACRLCKRRVGLWTFAPEHERTLDLAGAHVQWCPLRAGEWWKECALLRPVPGEQADAKALGEMIVVSESGRPRKRWRKA